jgi:hypothetical protein
MIFHRRSIVLTVRIATVFVHAENIAFASTAHAALLTCKLFNTVPNNVTGNAGANRGPFAP